MMGIMNRNWKPSQRSFLSSYPPDDIFFAKRSVAVTGSGGVAVCGSRSYNGVDTGFGSNTIYSACVAMVGTYELYCTVLVGGGGHITLFEGGYGMNIISPGSTNNTTTTFTGGFTIYSVYSHPQFNSGKVIAVGNDGTTGRISTAEYGAATDWTNRYSSTSVRPFCVTCSSSRVVVGGQTDGGNPVLLSSGNGTSWGTSYAVPSIIACPIMAIKIINGYFIAWGKSENTNRTTIFWSSNGIDWHILTLPTTIITVSDIFGYERNIYMIVSSSYAQTDFLQIYYLSISTDGTTLSYGRSNIPDIRADSLLVYSPEPLTVVERSSYYEIQGRAMCY